MSQLWFYGRIGHRLGPFTARQLKDLALAGKILVTDTVWKDGIANGVLGNRVKNLFDVPVVVAVPLGVVGGLSVESVGQTGVLPQSIPEVSAELAEAIAGATVKEESSPLPTPFSKPNVEKKPEKKLRAIALCGAKIMGQDGAFVQFIKICSVCKHEDSARTNVRIRVGKTKAPFYCRKCRKPRNVEIQGLNQ